MKLLSAMPSIIRKKLLLTLLAIAAFGMGLPSLALAKTEGAPDRKTEGAMGCLLGMAPEGCQAIFANARAARFRTTYCTEEYIHRRLDNCFNGPLETVKYLGANAAGADLYDVEFLNKHMTYILSRPAQDGRIGRFWIFEGSPGGFIGDQSLVTITVPPKPAPIEYSRSEQGA